MTVYVYTEQDTSPRFFEAIKAIKADTGIEDSIVPVTARNVDFMAADKPVVVFGKVEDPEYKHMNNIYTYSPAQTLTKANAVTVVGTALKRAAGRLPDVAHGPREINLVMANAPTKHIADEVAALVSASELVVDIEVSGNIKTGTPEDADVKLLTIAFYNPDTDRSVVFQGGWYGVECQRLQDVICAVLTRYEGDLIWHNGKFDVRALNRIMNDDIRVDHDTMLMHHVLNQAAGMHGLKDLCKLYFNAPEWEFEAKKYTKGGGHYENIPLSLLAEYNGLDVYWTYQLYKLLKPQIEADENAQTAYELELAASKFLLRVEQRGIPFDTAAALKLEEECKFNMEAEREAMKLLTRVKDFNPNSPIQVKTALQVMGHSVIGTSVGVLEELREKLQDDEVSALFIDSLLRYRKYAKISSTYVRGWMNKERDGFVHPTFLVHGTSTGRLSSSSPNAQNFPRNKEVRKIVGLQGVPETSL